MILPPWLLLTIVVAALGIGLNLGHWIKRRDRKPDPKMPVSNSEYRYARKILEEIRRTDPFNDSLKISRIVRTLREERRE